MKQQERARYTEQGYKFRKTVPLILLAGLRGTGKSWLLAALIRKLREEKPPIRIVQIDGENGIENGRQLHEAARALGVGPSALCIDNADGIEDLCGAVAKIIQNYTVTVCITGRKTVPLERALRETFSSSLGVVRITPFSFPEFLAAFERPDSRNSLELYSRAGGLPETGFVDPESDGLKAFLRMRANSFILTEIVEQHAIRNPAHLRLLLELIARSTGEILSARTIMAALSAQRITISPQAVLDYMDFCKETGLLFALPVLDIDKIKTVDAGQAWYFADVGLRTAFVKKETPANFDRALENLVLIHFLSEGWTVFQGRVTINSQTRAAVSFVCEKNEKKIYVQMAGNETSYGEKIRKRNALLAIRDAWPKYIADAEGALLDRSAEEVRDGIQTLFVRDLLLGKYTI